MSEAHWWSVYGPFRPWHECPTRPEPGEVLLFYLEKNGIGPDEQVSYLSDLLDLQKSMVYNILKGEGLDSISRCRILVQALKIPPPLLGLDAKYFPIERHAYWWRAFGYAFPVDAQGYPVMSEIVVHLRLKMTKIEEGGKVKVWTQEDMGDATGIKKETIYRFEHDKNPFVLESMSRRAIVATALGSIEEDKEETIFRLFGLDPQAYGVSVLLSDPLPELFFLPERLTDEILQDYQRTLSAFWTAYYTGYAQHLVEEAASCLKRLEALHHKAVTCAQRISLFALRCRFHECLAAVGREQMNTEHILDHLTMAVKEAEEAIDLAKSQLVDHMSLVLTHELLAAALFWRADAYFEWENPPFAQIDIDRALNLLAEVSKTQTATEGLGVELLDGPSHPKSPEPARGASDRDKPCPYECRGKPLHWFA